jgi:hypothetical protein
MLIIIIIFHFTRPWPPGRHGKLLQQSRNLKLALPHLLDAHANWFNYIQRTPSSVLVRPSTRTRQSPEPDVTRPGGLPARPPPRCARNFLDGAALHPGSPASPGMPSASSVHVRDAGWVGCTIPQGVPGSLDVPHGLFQRAADAAVGVSSMRVVVDKAYRETLQPPHRVARVDG